MSDTIVYRVGDTGNLPHQFLFQFRSAGLSGLASAAVARYVEFWCQENCQGRWQVIEFDETLNVGFDKGRDVVIFQLSCDEYTRFAKVNGIVSCPHHV